MDITERIANNLTILDVSGKIVRGDGDLLFKERLTELVANGQCRILVNLDSVTFIDSSGLGELISGYNAVAQAGGAMKLVNLTKRVQDLLAITKLLTVFDAFNDEETAIASFESTPQ